MPQMAPTMWLNLAITIIVMIMIMMTIMYFYKTNNNDFSQKNNKNILFKKMSW